MAVDEIPQNLDGKGLRIGIVIARFNEYAGRGEYEYCLGELKRLGVAEEEDRKSTRLNSSHTDSSRMPSSA